MKSLLVLVAFIVAVQSAGFPAEVKEQLQKADQDCIAVSGLTEEELDVAHRFPSVGENDPKIIKHLVCFLQKLHYLNDDGTISEEVTRARLTRANISQSNIDKVVKDCIVPKSATVEETSAKFVKCKRGILGHLKNQTKN